MIQKINYADKQTGGKFSASDANEIKSTVNLNADVLSENSQSILSLQGGSLGSIKPTDAAPTPARNGNYTFSIGGDKPAWLTAEAGVTTVKAGDGVAVVYTEPSTYSYTHVDVSSDFASKDELVQVRSDLNYYNISESKPIYPLYYTLGTAVAAVPVVVRKKGLVVTYATSATTWETKQFFQGEIAAWTTVSNWKGFPYDITSNFSGGEGKVAGAVETKELKDNEEEFVYRGSLSKTFEIETPFAYDTTTVNKACSEGDVIAVKSGMPLNATESTVISITFTDSSNQTIGIPIFTKAGLTANITAPANSKFFLVEFAYTIAHTIPANTTVEINDIEVKNTSNIANRIVILEERKKVTEYVDIHVKKDFTGDFIDIQEAINACNDASSLKIYRINIYDNHSCSTTGGMWQSNTIGKTGVVPQRADVGMVDIYKSFITTRDHIQLIGIGDQRIIEVEIPLSIVQQEKLDYIVPLHLRGNCTLENIKIVSKNVKYTMHIETMWVGDNQDVLQNINNVALHHLGNPDYLSGLSDWTLGCALGCGLSSGQHIIFNNCKIIGNSITMHTNVAFNKGTIVEFKNTHLDRGLKLMPNPVDATSYSESKSIGFYDLSSQVKNKIILENCSGLGLFGTSVSTKYENHNNAWLAYPELEIKNCRPFAPFSTAFFSGSDIKVLKFSPLTNGSVISVISGDAINLIYGDEHVKSIKHESIKSFCAGTIYLSDAINANGNYKQALGNRLGDCSVINKTLMISCVKLDGTYQQGVMTFNKNYGGNTSNPPLISQEAILADINIALSWLLTCSIGVDLSYPENSDTYELVVNSSNEQIEIGMGIKFDYANGVNRVRKAISGERIDGVALDVMPILSSISTYLKSGRMLKRGNLITAWDFWRPYKTDSEWDYVAGKFYKIGTTPGVFIQTSVESDALLVGLDNITYKIL